MERINDDSGVREEQQRRFHRRMFARLGGRIAAREVRVPVSEQATEQAETEPHAGYYVASQSRPAFVTRMTSDQIAGVFDLVEKVSNFPRSQQDETDDVTLNGAQHPNGNGNHQ
jgi:hypothetical protein